MRASRLPGRCRGRWPRLPQLSLVHDEVAFLPRILCLINDRESTSYEVFIVREGGGQTGCAMP